MVSTPIGRNRAWLLVSMETTIRGIVGSIGGRSSFEKGRDFLSPEFASVVQRILDDAGAPQNSHHHIDDEA